MLLSDKRKTYRILSSNKRRRDESIGYCAQKNPCEIPLTARFCSSIIVLLKTTVLILFQNRAMNPAFRMKIKVCAVLHGFFVNPTFILVFEDVPEIMNYFYRYSYKSYVCVCTLSGTTGSVRTRNHNTVQETCMPRLRNSELNTTIYRKFLYLLLAKNSFFFR